MGTSRLLALLGATAAAAAPFTPGNVAVLRSGDGASALGTNGSPLAIVEMDYNTGAIVSAERVVSSHTALFF